MAINVTFYTFSKKDNSTAQPSGSGSAYSCTLKEPCSAVSPEIVLNIGIGNPTSYNYCYIADFSRYYYISDWSYDRGLWHARLKVDVLATYKSYIGSASLYVLRAAAEYDGNIIDNMYPITCEVDADNDLPAAYWWTLGAGVTSGCFIVGILAKIDSDATYGGVTYLAFTYDQFAEFTRQMFADDLSYYDGQNLGIAESLAKMLIQPFDYITTVTWIPELPAGAVVHLGFNIGFWEFTGACYTIPPAAQLTYSSTITPHAHPQAARGQYLNTSPYTLYYMYLPRIGTVPVDASLLANASSVTVTLSVDVITGAGVYVLQAQPDSTSQNDPIIIGRYSAQIGVAVQLASTGFFSQGAGAVMGTVEKIVSDSARMATGSIMGGLGAIGDLAGIFAPHIDATASQGGYLGLAGAVQPFMIHIHYLVTDDDNAHAGKPLCQEKTINTLSGYIMCREGDISMPGTYGEYEAVRSYLEQGFYYE